MTKRVNWLPNLRVDVPDMTDGTNTLSSGLMKQNFNQFILDNFARIAAGFRVEIANQISSPGQFTVYNGIGFDRSGQILQNEDEENASRSLTLLANGQYFVEVQFVTDQTNTDARGFWDPTVDNGTDPSGDVRLPGREFSQNIATRLTPDWQIVNPPSTTGFDITTNPNSLKVPVAAIRVTAGVITAFANPLVNARTVLANAVLAGVTKIKVLESRLFPDTFNATVDSEAVVVTANDRTNGILTLAAITGLAHAAGARVAITGAGLATFLAERTTPPIPLSTSVVSEDGRPHYWQADEERGFALSQDPYAGTGRADVSIQSLKDQVDFLSAQVREMRFGAEKNVEIGQLAPPTAFPLSPRYFDKSGGLQGARTATVTIGDGSTSWGDFNVAQIGSIEAALNAALAVLPATGGRIHIKASPNPYIFTSNVTISNEAILTGDGNGTVLRVQGGTPGLTLDAGCELYNLRITLATTSTALVAVDFASSNELTIRDCYIEGIDLGVAGGMFDNVFFTTAVSGGTNGIAMTGSVLIDCNFTNCHFVSQIDLAAARAVSMPGPNISEVRFTNCTFSAPSTNPTAIVDLATVDSATNVLFYGCSLTGGASGSTGINVNSVPTTSNYITVRDCVSTCPGRLVYMDNVQDCLVAGCSHNCATPDVSGIEFGASINNRQISIVDCTVINVGAPSSSCAAVRVGIARNLEIRNVVGRATDYCILLSDVLNAAISNCKYFGDGGGAGSIAYRIYTSSQNTTISNCEAWDLQNANNGYIAGIDFEGTHTNLRVDNCSLQFIGSGFEGVGAIAIRMQPAAGTRQVSITNCKIQGVSVADPQGTRGIAVQDDVVGLNISENDLQNIGGVSTGQAIGIIVSGGGDIHISNNRILSVGHPAGINHGVYIGAGSSFTANDLVISSNTIRGINGGPATLQGDIQLYNAGFRANICNNVLAMINLNKVGISVQQDSGSSMFDYTVSDNQIGAIDSNSCIAGIAFLFASSSARRISVTGNTIRGFRNVGILVFNSVASARNVVVNNNTLFTDNDLASTDMITLTRCIEFTCNGNSLECTEMTSNNKKGIFLSSSANGVVSGNYIRLGRASNAGVSPGAHIFGTAIVAVFFTANLCLYTDLLSTGYGIRVQGASSLTVAFANMFQNFNGNTDISGVNYITPQQAFIATPNAGTDPSAFSNIDMNISLT